MAEQSEWSSMFFLSPLIEVLCKIASFPICTKYSTYKLRSWENVNYKTIVLSAQFSLNEKKKTTAK
jgi:hypothetical protein